MKMCDIDLNSCRSADLIPQLSQRWRKTFVNINDRRKTKVGQNVYMQMRQTSSAAERSSVERSMYIGNANNENSLLTKRIKDVSKMSCSMQWLGKSLFLIKARYTCIGALGCYWKYVEFTHVSSAIDADVWHFLSPVYTIQPVVKPVVKPVW